jgi:hypothetical protein
VALIAPALPAVAAGRLGYNNGHVESDGVLRRFRPFETLRDGSVIRSTAMAALSVADAQAARRALDSWSPQATEPGQLVAWRAGLGAYPHIPFAQVFAAADGGKASTPAADFRGKILIIGSTAPSLHDIHPTPVSAMHPGVDALATVIDNAVNERQLAELPRWVDALLAISLSLGLAFWVRTRKDTSLLTVTFTLPAALLFVSYLTLNGSPVFIDLQLSAGLALLFLALVRYWSRLRRARWCEPPAADPGGLLLWPLLRREPWLEAPLDRLIDALELHAPHCRVVVPDVHEAAFQGPRWPELALHAAVVGPAAELQSARPFLLLKTPGLRADNGDMLPLGQAPGRLDLAEAALGAWKQGLQAAARTQAQPSGVNE